MPAISYSPTYELVARHADLCGDFRPGRFQLLNTTQSVDMRPRLHAFESSVMGNDFGSEFGDFGHWFASGNLFYASVCHSGPDAVPKIDALVSVLVADRRSCARLVEGRIAEHQLVPWSCGERTSSPVLYFSTIICPERNWQPLLYGSLLSDLLRFQSREGLQIETGLSIACTADGTRHLSKNGFARLPGRKYLGRHSFLVISALSAKTAFWQTLLAVRPSRRATAIGQRTQSAPRQPDTEAYTLEPDSGEVHCNPT
jgi:hypothetical protein